MHITEQGIYCNTTNIPDRIVTKPSKYGKPEKQSMWTSKGTKKLSRLLLFINSTLGPFGKIIRHFTDEKRHVSSFQGNSNNKNCHNQRIKMIASKLY